MHKLVGLGLFCATATTAFGQTANVKAAAEDEQLQEVVVTGTLIRGEAPIGSPVVTLDHAAIEATGATNTADILATIPALTTFNTLPIGGNQEFRST
jgi:iron complex outermembrane recepter protein